jgi:D-glycero-D-manno-heptose 1,7-bisphosphate phosphatase
MIRAVLFDRDGTLIVDRSGFSSRVTLMPYAREALQSLRSRGLRLGVVTNQPCVAQGTVHYNEVCEINQRISEELGPIDGWFICPHDANDRCDCRKPLPGLIYDACRQFEVSPDECAVIGDIGSDVDAASAAGAYPILVPTPVTLPEELSRAPVVCTDLRHAVDHIFAREVMALL